MPVKSYKPTSPGLRQRTTSDFSEITKSAPEKSLTRGKLKTGGRDSRGHLTSWWRGGGHKKRYRTIDFKRDKHDIPAKVASIEYDPNRSAHIALLNYADGEKRYLSLIHISEPTRLGMISYAVFCLKKKKNKNK